MLFHLFISKTIYSKYTHIITIIAGYMIMLTIVMQFFESKTKANL